MPASNTPTVIVICGTASAAPKPARHGHHGGMSFPVPVSWIASAERLGAVVAAIGATGSLHDYVLQIPAAAFACRQRLRRLLALGRESVPSLSAIAVKGGGAIEHKVLLVEEGIRVVLVDALSGNGRSSRRPAPTGWRCHHPTWGLWEVELSSAAPRGPLSVFGLSSRPCVRRGGLAVLEAEGWDSQGTPCHRLERIAAWAARKASSVAGEVSTVSGLVARLAGDDQQSLAGSVLRAA